jgi:hypothetical protein
VADSAQGVADLEGLAGSKTIVIDEREAMLFFSFDLIISPLQLLDDYP